MERKGSQICHLYRLWNHLHGFVLLAHHSCWNRANYVTPYIGAAWILTHNQSPNLENIKIVRHWGRDIGVKVPSVFTYSSSAGNQKWGYNVGNSAYVIRWTKLNLEVPKERLVALKSLRYSLDDAKMLNFDRNKRQTEIPRHLIRTSGDIVTDYLKEVIDRVRASIENSADTRRLEQFPIDIVITHPAVWDERAKNLTFRAVMQAFQAVFQDLVIKPGFIRLATEPEACAQYTLQAARAAGMVETRQLRVGECFIVVDAGGGTVDLVSYRIDQITPVFKFSKVTSVTGGEFGATRIDRCFLEEFLPQRLGYETYQLLLAQGGSNQMYGRANHTVLTKGEQFMLDGFENIKRDFKGRIHEGTVQGNKILNLPAELSQQLNGSSGRLTVTCEDMEMMFQDCVDGITGLIQEQLGLVDDLGLLVRSIFLSGGFSNNEYLFKCINELARSWQFQLLRAADCWTAVAKGGVLMGLGVECPVPRPVVPCYYSFGVIISKHFSLYDHRAEQRYTDSLDGIARARDHIEWVVLRGDLIVCDEPTEKTVRLVRKLTQNTKRAGRVTIVLSAADDERQRLSPADRKFSSPHEPLPPSLPSSSPPLTARRGSGWIPIS